MSATGTTGTTGTLRNGVRIGEQVATISVPYRAQRETRYRLRERRTYWASCPDCGWHTTGNALAFVRRDALNHPCPERCPVCGEAATASDKEQGSA